MQTADFPTLDPPAAEPRPGGIKGQVLVPRQLTQEFYAGHPDQNPALRTAEHSITRNVACMVRYTLWRLQRSKGAPVSINQSAMAAFFDQERAAAPHDKPMCYGPSLRTISRSWQPFVVHLIVMGYRARRAHSPGVGLDGKKRKGTRQSKLGWVVYSLEWEKSGNDILGYLERRPKRQATGKKLRSRWVRDEARNLLSDYETPPIHYDRITSNALSSGEQTESKKQISPTEDGKVVNNSGSSSRLGQENTPLSVELRRKHASWRLPGWAARKIWAISKRYLNGKEAGFLAYRAMDLWHAAHDAKRLFFALERASAWASEATTKRGKIAAAVFAGFVMKVPDPHYHPPSSEEFWRWIETNADQWRTDTTRQISDYCVRKLREAGHDPETFLREQRAAIRQLEAQFLQELVAAKPEPQRCDAHDPHTLGKQNTA